MSGLHRDTARRADRVNERSLEQKVSHGICSVGANEIFIPHRPPAAVSPSPSLADIRDQLSDRDLAILNSLAVLRFATTRQLQRLHFTAGSPLTLARRSRRSLQRLHELGLVSRLERRIGGIRAGSAGLVHQLTPKGRRLLGLAGPQGGLRRTLPDPALPTQAHRLAIADLAVDLYETHRSGGLDLLRFEAEPECWRTYVGPGGSRRHLRPDAFVVVGVGAWENLWFVEVDLGTETLGTLERKTAAYRAYAASGDEQKRWSVFPRVAYLTTTSARRDGIQRALQRCCGLKNQAVALLGDATAVLSSDGPR